MQLRVILTAVFFLPALILLSCNLQTRLVLKAKYLGRTDRKKVEVQYVLELIGIAALTSLAIATWFV